MRPNPTMGESGSYRALGVIRMAKAVKGSQSTFHPPSEDPVAELANLELWSKRPSLELAPLSAS